MPDLPVGARAHWLAPGRVNLIGEHTDYNHGLALPFAIEQSCRASVVVGESGFIAVSAQREDVAHARDVGEIMTLPTWARYVLGPVWAVAARGTVVPPLRVEIDSEVPLGAGLSSSAAVVCSVTTALLDLLGVELDGDEQLALTRRVENDVVGVPTGGLDQMAALRSQAGHALLCDFADLSSRPVPLDLAPHGLTVLVVDTGVEHQHSEGEYAARRRDCELAAEVVGVASLRELDASDLASQTAQTSPAWTGAQQRYVRHVVTENQRVREVVELLEAGRPAEIGPVLSASHASLRDDYRVSGPALDLAQSTLLEAGALGARMTGGGFGGAVVALVPQDHAAAIGERATSALLATPGAATRRPRSLVVAPSAGARRWSGA